MRRRVFQRIHDVEPVSVQAADFSAPRRRHLQQVGRQKSVQVAHHRDGRLLLRRLARRQRRAVVRRRPATRLRQRPGRDRLGQREHAALAAVPHRRWLLGRLVGSPALVPACVEHVFLRERRRSRRFVLGPVPRRFAAAGLEVLGRVRHTAVHLAPENRVLEIQLDSARRVRRCDARLPHGDIRAGEQQIRQDPGVLPPGGGVLERERPDHYQRVDVFCRRELEAAGL
mmetsp:Transcript_62177/g.189881  ORF Transcript_62177/g.189881 Transcript_62177/m.189881 type:complete len:228 (+) Transcript_62177:612-1295(+)